MGHGLWVMGYGSWRRGQVSSDRFHMLHASLETKGTDGWGLMCDAPGLNDDELTSDEHTCDPFAH
jgi:hypothetical protein